MALGNDIEKKLWEAADELRANSKLKASEYSAPVLGLIFLRYADSKFAAAEGELAKKATGRRQVGKADYQARGVMFLPEKARYQRLVALPESADIGKAINEAMKAVEEENEELRGILPKNYSAFDNALLVSLLRNFASIPMDIEGDVFGKIYEYFLGEFAKAEGSKGGEFFTPTSLVKLIVEVIEPFHGRICDLASGSGGMFVQSARFVKAHAEHGSLTLHPSPTGRGTEGEGAQHRRGTEGEGAQHGRGARGEGVAMGDESPSPSGRGVRGEGAELSPMAQLSIFGQEKTAETVRLCKMNLAVHGLSGDIREGNSYYEDIHKSPGRFDFVMANPPFNVNKIDKERLKNDTARFPFGMPSTDNGNYLWIQLFYSALGPKGRAGFVMANSAADARSSEQEIRKQLIQALAVDVMVAIGPNFFYTVTLPCTLWFLDKGKATLPPSPQPSPSGRGSKGEGIEDIPPSPGPSGHPLPGGEGQKTGHYRGGFDISALVDKARAFRKKQTKAEEVLWEVLRDRQFLNFKFRRQHQIGPYIVDFLCSEEKLVIEIDGGYHRDMDRVKHDQKRDKYLSSSGFQVVRLQNDQVLESIGDALAEIVDVLHPSPAGRGNKGEGEQKGARYSDTVLFIDARHVFRQVDRAHRDFAPMQTEFLANIARLYRGEQPSAVSLGHPLPMGEGRGEGAQRRRRKEDEGDWALKKYFPDGKYRDVPGLCRVATIKEIEAQSWSLNPGRYVGVAEREDDGFDFKERLEELNEELEALNAEAHSLEERIAENVTKLLDAE